MLGFIDRLSKARLPEPMVRAWPSPAASRWLVLFNALEVVNQIQLQIPFGSCSALPAPSLELVQDFCVRHGLFGCHTGSKRRVVTVSIGNEVLHAKLSTGSKQKYRDTQKSVCVSVQTNCRGFLKNNVSIATCFSLGGKEDRE